MSGSYTQKVRSKWAKTKVLIASPQLRQYVPHTKLLNRATLSSMLKRYGMVYVKPDIGSSGIGVAKVQRLARDGAYLCRWGARAVKAFTFESLHRLIGTISPRRPYLVQKGIHVLRHNGRPFDIRVMVQMSPRGQWETTGIIGRIAHPNKIVTNRSGGGDIMQAGPLLAGQVSEERTKSLLRELILLGVRVAGHMRRTYPGIKELGLDIAIDRELKPWILEVNTTPVVKLFHQLEDKRMIRKIIRYGKAYGRTFHNLR